MNEYVRKHMCLIIENYLYSLDFKFAYQIISSIARSEVCSLTSIQIFSMCDLFGFK